MGPKIYLLILLFSMIIVGSSHANLRELLQKLHFGRLWSAKRQGA